MQDNEFDSWIKSALNEYRDHTSVETGWARFQSMQPAALTANPLKAWLKLSIVTNAGLVGAILWLMWPTAPVEAPRTGARQPGALQAVNSAGTVAGSREKAGDLPELSRDSGKQAAEALPSWKSTAAPSSIHANEPFAAAAPMVSHFDRLSGKKGTAEWQIGSRIPELVLPHPQKTPAPPVASDKKVSLPLETAIALEKQKMGNRIGWSAGVQPGAGFAQYRNGLQGYLLSSGVVVDAALHPMLVVRTGLALQRTRATTERQETISGVWQTSASGTPPPGTDRLALSMLSAEIPLLLRLRLPVSHQKSWYVQAGLFQNFGLRDHPTFYGQKAEEEDEADYEIETHRTTVAEFSNDKPGRHYTGLAGEAGFRKGIGTSRWRWEAGVFYKQGLGPVSESVGRAQLWGVHTGIFFSGWE